MYTGKPYIDDGKPPTRSVIQMDGTIWRMLIIAKQIDVSNGPHPNNAFDYNNTKGAKK